MRKQAGMALLTVAWLWGMPALGQDIKETLRALPEESLGIVVTNRLDQVDDKLQIVVKKMQIPLPITILELGKASVGISKGLNAKGSAAVAFVPPGEQDRPVPVFFVPVSDYGEFVGQFQAKDKGIVEISLPDGRKMAVAKKGSFAVLVDGDQSDVLKKVLAATGNLASWAEPVQSWLEENDVTVLATPRGLKKGISSTRQALAQAAEGIAKQEAQDLLVGWFKSIDNVLKSVETDLTHVGLATRIDKAGNVLMDVRGLFVMGGKLAKRGADVKGLSGGPLGGLPAGPYAMAFGGVIPQNFMENMLKMNLEMMKAANKGAGADQSKEKLDKLEKSFAQLAKGFQGMAFVMRTSKENETMFSRVVGIMRTENAAGYLENYEKMIPEMNGLYKDLAIPLLPQVELKKKTVGKLTVLETETTLPLKEGDNVDPMRKKLMDAMFGAGGKIKSSLAALDANTIVVTYTGAAGLFDIAKELANKKGLQDDAEVGRTLGLLPQGSQWVFLASPRGTTEMVGQWVKVFAPNLPIQVPEFPQTPPVGIGARVSETGLNIQVVIPIQIFEGIGQLIGGQKGT